MDITPDYPLTPSSETPGGGVVSDTSLGSMMSSGTMVQPERKEMAQTVGPMTATANTLTIGSGNKVFNITSRGIWLGAATFANAPFSVDMEGNLVATSATISGAISASTIDIGGSDTSSFHVDGDGNLWAGAATFNINTNPFAVSSAGALRATSGVIGGFTITSTTLSAAGITLDSGNFRIGVGASNEILIDGANKKIESSNYVSGIAGAGFHLDSNLLEVGNISARGLIRTAVFQKDVISTVGGNLMVLDGDVLNADMTALSGIVENLIAYYKLDGNSNEEISSYNGTDTDVSYVAGKINNCASFNGTTSKIVITDNSSFHLTGNYTISFWANVSNAAVINNEIFFQTMSNNPNAAGIKILRLASDQKLRFLMGHNTGTTVGVDFQEVFSSAAINDGVWHLWTCVYDGVNISIYKDGTFDNSAAWTHNAVYAATNYVRMGVRNDVGVDEYFLNGKMDELGVWNRALSQTEITALYNSNSGLAFNNMMATLTTKGNTTFAVNDILRIKDGTDDEWMRVINIDNAPLYIVIRDKASVYAMDTNPAWKKGATIVNYGQSGDGGIYMTASDSNAPYLSIFDHAGSPWSTINTRLRIGNLNGYLGYATDLYGIAIGETTKYLKYDSTNGLRIAGDITATSGKFGTTTNYWSVGANGLTAVSASADVMINYGKTDFTNTDTGFILGYDYSASKAKFYIGSSTSYFNWDGTNIDIFGNIISGTAGSTRTQLSSALLKFYNSSNKLILELLASGGLGSLTFFDSDGSANSSIICASEGLIIQGDDSAKYLYLNDDMYVGRKLEPVTNQNTVDLGATTSGHRFRTIYLINAPDVSSSRKGKDNIENIIYGLSEILEMQPVSFTRKEQEKGNIDLRTMEKEPDSEITDVKNLGFIAEDLHKIVPEVAGTESYKPTHLIPILVKAIQELNKKIEDLKIKVNKL